MAALKAMEVLEDSSLRNPEKMPYLAPPPPIQSQANATDEEDTPSMRELVQAIDTHVEIVSLEVTSNLNAVENEEVQQPPAEDVPDRQADDAVHLPPIDPSV